MADTVDSVLREILSKGVQPPKPGDVLYHIVADLAQLIITTRNNRSLKSYERQHQINDVRAEIYNAVTREEFERRTPRNLRKFYPGGCSADGFLGWGESLDKVIADDRQTLRELDTIPKVSDKQPHEVVGARLKEILDAPRMFPRISLSTSSTPGSQECPFDECHWAIYPHSGMQFTVIRGNAGIVGPGMIWHLIEAHCFFEGFHSPYRVDPKQLVNILFD